MSLFAGQEIKRINKRQLIFENRLDAADGDRRRIKDNADKLGGMITDLECKVKTLQEAKSHGKKHKK